MIPYHTDANGIETSVDLGSRTATVNVWDHANKSTFLEVTLGLDGDTPKVWFAKQRIARKNGAYMREIKVSDRIAQAALLGYERHLKIGKEPVTGDYVAEGQRVIDIENGMFITTYDEPKDRVVYIGGGAIEWHKQVAA